MPINFEALVKWSVALAILTLAAVTHAGTIAICHALQYPNLGAPAFVSGMLIWPLAIIFCYFYLQMNPDDGPKSQSLLRLLKWRFESCAIFLGVAFGHMAIVLLAFATEITVPPWLLFAIGYPVWSLAFFLVLKSRPDAEGQA